MDELVKLFLIQESIVDNHVKVCIFHYLAMRMKVALLVTIWVDGMGKKKAIIFLNFAQN